jgi:hypothetical protein
MPHCPGLAPELDLRVACSRLPCRRRHKQRKLFKLGPDVLGGGPFKFAWRPGGQMIATASMKGGALLLLLLR